MFVTPSEDVIRPWPLTSYTFNTFAQYIQYFNADECKQYIRDGKENERTTVLKKGEVGNAEANTTLR